MDDELVLFYGEERKEMYWRWLYADIGSLFFEFLPWTMRISVDIVVSCKNEQSDTIWDKGICTVV